MTGRRIFPAVFNIIHYYIMINKIVYLHIPHTSGRTIKRTLWLNSMLKDILPVHNAKDIKDAINNIDSNSKLYFVLREPLDRIIGEYKHYSRSLKTKQVNHLTQNDVKDINLDNILEYCSMEVNRNVMCKFLLLKTNFLEKINDNNYKLLEQMFKGQNKPLFDNYTFPLVLPVLSDLVGSKVEPAAIMQNVEKNDILLDSDICNKLKELNKYDFLLYDFLQHIQNIKK